MIGWLNVEVENTCESRRGIEADMNFSRKAGEGSVTQKRIGERGS